MSKYTRLIPYEDYHCILLLKIEELMSAQTDALAAAIAQSIQSANAIVSNQAALKATIADLTAKVEAQTATIAADDQAVIDATTAVVGLQQSLAAAVPA